MDSETEVSKAAAVATSSDNARALNKFSKVEVIQGKPVSTMSAAEGQPVSFQPAAASSGISPGMGSLDEGLMSDASTRKRPPFLLELFCGTAGVCAQFRLLGGKALGIDHHLKRSKLMQQYSCARCF